MGDGLGLAAVPPTSAGGLRVRGEAMKDPYPIHGRRWRWRKPLQWSCRCGMDAYPCVVEEMLSAPFDLGASADALYEAGLRFAQSWRDDERRGWGRAR